MLAMVLAEVGNPALYAANEIAGQVRGPKRRVIAPLQLVEDLFAVQKLAAPCLVQSQIDLVPEPFQGGLSDSLLLLKQSEALPDHLAGRGVPTGGHSRGDELLELRRQGDVQSRSMNHRRRLASVTQCVNRVPQAEETVVVLSILYKPMVEQWLRKTRKPI
jgi:hypothetical protein